MRVVRSTCVPANHSPAQTCNKILPQQLRKTDACHHTNQRAWLLQWANNSGSHAAACYMRKHEPCCHRAAASTALSRWPAPIATSRPHSTIGNEPVREQLSPHRRKQ